MVLRELVAYDERSPDRLPSGYQSKPVRYEIRLDAEGRRVGPVLDLADGSEKATKRGQAWVVPHLKRANGIRPILLADNAEYVLGLAREGSKPDRVVKQHDAFVEVVRACAAQTGDDLVDAVVRFLTEDGPDRRADVEFPGVYDPTGDIGFVVDGARPVDRPAVQAFWAARAGGGETPAEAATADAKVTVKPGAGALTLACLVCGNVRPVLERQLLKIKGVPGGQAGGTDLISANAGAFESYGLKASQIVPICADCSEKYANGLNRLLRDKPTHLRVGEMAYAFWAVEATEFDPATLFSEPDSEGMAEQVRELIDAARTGRAAAVDLDPTPFYALALSASGSRTVVREWIDQTVGEAKRSLGRYFALQAMVDGTGADGPPLPIWRLASATVRYRSGDAPDPDVPAALLALALRGDPLPLGLAFQAIRRCRIESQVTRERAALIKMVLATQPPRDRDPQPGEWPGMTMEEITRMTDLDATRTTPAYLCGRLLAVLDSIQYAALKQTNATVVDKFYGTASSAPGSVFGNLLGNAQPHLAKLRKERPGVQRALERRLEEVLADLPVFPKTLSLPDQGLFALGFYHQRAADRRAAREAKERGQVDVAEALTPGEDV